MPWVEAKNADQQNQARLAVARARRRGELLHGLCENCGKDAGYAHHDDYAKPLEVRWLCQSCHMNHHWEVDPQIAEWEQRNRKNHA